MIQVTALLFVKLLLGRFSLSVQEHIKARDFENRLSSRKIDVISLTTGECKGTVLLNDFVFGTNPR